MLALRFMKLQLCPSRCRVLGARKLTLAIAVLASLILFNSSVSGEETHSKDGSRAAMDEFVATALRPFWRTNEIREPIFFVEEKSGERPTGKLLFKPTEIISMTSATRTVKFEAGKDFIVDAKSGTISLPAGSRVPFTTQEQLYPLMSSNLPKKARSSGDKTRGIFFSEDGHYHKLQVEVRYRYEPGQWKEPTPKYAGDLLPKTVAKLRSKEPVRIVLLGDSISTGDNASAKSNMSPHCPGYGELTALALEKHFGGKVTLHNKAIGGTTSDDGIRIAKEIGKEKLDLAIIAYGMNDVYRKHDAAKYKANIQATMKKIRADTPNVEFILVASMLQNVERGIPMDKFPLYRDALKQLSGRGVAMADMTSMWEALLKRKTFYDITGNGLNHPNDFGHCVYAQTLLALLIDAPKR